MERDHLQGLHWNCFVCGPDNPRGLRLNIRLAAGKTHAEWTPTAEYQGPPGITHSGVVSALLNEMMAQLIYAKLIPAVTRKVEVTYRRPMRIGTPYRFTGEVAGENRRIIAMRAEARDPDGVQVARARAVFAPLVAEQMARFLGQETDANGGQA